VKKHIEVQDLVEKTDAACEILHSHSIIADRLFGHASPPSPVVAYGTVTRYTARIVL
jgi:hypothetical protein